MEPKLKVNDFVTYNTEFGDSDKCSKALGIVIEIKENGPGECVVRWVYNEQFPNLVRKKPSGYISLFLRKVG